MNPNNPFGMEIDDDGLPKYSPDRKNIAAYHMYKLGLTDKLPDPEESHTPFFRTPSWYEEKARRERQAQAGLSPTFEAEPDRIDPEKPDSPDFFSKYPINGDEFDSDKKPAFPAPSTGQNPFSADTHDPYGQAGQKEKDAPFGKQVEKGQNKEAFPLDTKAFGRQALGLIFGEMKPVVPTDGLDGGLQKQPFSGTGRMGEPQQYASPKEPVSPEKPDTPEKGVDWSGQVSPSASRTRPVELNRAMPLPVQGDESGNNMSLPLADEASRAIQGKSDMPDTPDMSARVADLGNPAGYRTLELKSGEREKDEGSWSSGLFPLLFFRPELIGKGDLSAGAIEAAGLTGMEVVPVQDAVYPEKEEAPVDHAADLGNETARGWMNEDASQSGTQQEAGALKDGDFSPDSLEAPSAGETAKRALGSAFANDNTANPGFAPMQVAILSPNQFKMLPGRREVPVEMTNSINSDLTRLNRGWAIGINFTVVSRFEGGSHPEPNIPISNKDLNEERRLIAEDRKNGTNKAQKMKWPNNSGVTVGCGFDLGQLASRAAGIASLREYGFLESFVQKFAPYLGKKRVEADDFLKTHKLVLSQDEINTVNRLVMTQQAKDCIGRWDEQIALIRKTNPRAPFFHEMSSTLQTIVFSRHYHQGPGWYQKNINKAVYNAMLENDWPTVKRQFQGLINRSKPEWLKNRFRKEQIFLKKGSR